MSISSLEDFMRAGVLEAADVHMARTLGRLAQVSDPSILLAVALATRAPRLGHTAVDLERVAETVVAETVVVETFVAEPADAPVALADLVWPEPGEWVAAVGASPLVSVLAQRLGLPDPERPLVLAGGLLSLQRYWAHERLIAENLAARLEHSAAGIGAGIERDLDAARVLLTGEGSEQQLEAVRVALEHPVTILTGGPGTGKTTTVAALLAVLLSPAVGDGDRPGAEPLRVALCAPTGKAAARLSEAFRQAAARLPEHIARRLAVSEASTIHRLLGTSHDGFAHHRHRLLPHDVVILDESSMVSLPLMASLLDAVAPTARLVIVGDPGQLASVEAGTVLADLVAATRPSRPDEPLPENALAARLAPGVAQLTTSRRFPDDSTIGQLAAAINAGDAARAIEVLEGADGSDSDLTWLRAPDGATERATDALDPALIGRLQTVLAGAARTTADAANSGDAAVALASLEQVRLLCAHRRGPFGVGHWNRQIREWVLAGTSPVGSTAWIPGQPVLVTANDYRLQLFNGDLGVMVRDPDSGRLRVAFWAAADTAVDAAVDADTGSAPGLRWFDPLQIDALEPAHAMTIHKSQGSEFDHVVVMLPPAASRLASRELLYTAVTRARRKVTVVGSAAMIEAAVERRVNRATGLADELRAFDLAVG